MTPIKEQLNIIEAMFVFIYQIIVWCEVYTRYFKLIIRKKLLGVFKH